MYKGYVGIVAVLILCVQCVHGWEMEDPVYATYSDFENYVKNLKATSFSLANSISGIPNFHAPRPSDYTKLPPGPSIMYFCATQGYNNEYCSHLWTKVARDQLKLEKMDDAEHWPSRLVNYGPATINNQLLAIDQPDVAFFMNALNNYSKICNRHCVGPFQTASGGLQFNITGFQDVWYTPSSYFKVDPYGGSYRFALDVPLSETAANYVWGSGMIAYACLNSDGQTWRYGTTMRLYANTKYTDVVCVLQAFLVLDKGSESDSTTNFKTIASPFFGFIDAAGVSEKLATAVLNRLVNLIPS